MIFVLRYDRQTSTLVERREVADPILASVESQDLRTRFPEERWEIVELEADSLDVLKRTHGRYFLTSKELLDGLHVMTSSVISD